MKVKTTSKDLKFRIQGKLANCETAITVIRDHNVMVKIRDNCLIEIKAPDKLAKPIKKKTENKKNN